MYLRYNLLFLSINITNLYMLLILIVPFECNGAPNGTMDLIHLFVKFCSTLFKGIIINIRRESGSSCCSIIFMF